MTDTRTHATLRRISDALGMAPADFFGPDTLGSTGSPKPTAQEAAELLEAFTQITDPTIRRECLNFVRARVSGERSKNT